MIFLYSAVLAVALVLTLPYWALQMLRHGKYRAGLRERLGRVPPRLKQGSKVAIWVHAVSVGEVLAVSGIIQQLRAPGSRIVEQLPAPLWDTIDAPTRDRLSSDVRRTFDPDGVLNPGILAPLS